MLIEIKETEKLRVLQAIRFFKDKTVSVATIANKAGYNANRVRFIIDLLLQECRIKKIPVKNFNKHYRRYRYEVTNSLSSTK